MEMSISRAKVLRGALAGLAMMAVGAPALAQQGVNGRNVTAVITPQGEFVLLPGGQWTERGSNGAGFNFTEQNRDDWSVYLFDASRNVRLQLDLHRRKVGYSDGGAMSDLYDITGSSAAVNGRNVSRVDFRGGSYRMTGPSKWVEAGTNGGTFTFSEESRDDWSVYLNDRSRNVRIQLDLHTRKVMYADSGAPQKRPLYEITGSSAIGN